FKYGDTVYVFAVLRAGWTKGDTWTRIGETTSYRVASHSMEDATYDFGKIEAVATTYSITYNTNGGGAIAAGSYTIHASNHTVALTTPTRTGYTFTGYTITTNTTGGTSSVSTKTTLNIPANAYGNVTVEAGWSVNSYTVTLNTNGGTINAGNVTSYTYGYGATLPTNVTKTAYSFGGWYDNSGLTGTAVTSISTTATGNKTYWAKWNILNNKYYVSINGTKTLLNTKTDGAGDVIYQLSPASKLTVWGGDKIGFYDGSTLLTTAVLSADVDPDNNVVSTTATDNLWEINNYNGSADLYFKLKTDGTFVFWLSGKESRSETSYGVTSGDTFYVQDLLIKNNQGSNFGANNAKIAVYFYNPVGESSSIHKWSTEFATLQKSEGGVDLYSLTVPTYNGHSMKWGGAIAVRFASDMTVGNLEAHGFDWCIKKDDNPNMKNGVNPGNFADDSQNTIQIQYWWGESLPGGYNASGNYTMYIDAGLASGTGIYVDPTNAYGGWDFKGDTSSYHIYGYFFSIVDGDGEAFNWSAAAHKVDGETNLYEIEVPKDRSGNNVEWGKLIVVYSPSAGWVTEQNKYQTQDLWYSSALQSHTHITFTGNSTGELKSEASHDATYTDATRAERWGTNFLSNVTCNNGVTAPSTAGWGTSSTDYSNMSTAARTIVTNSTVGSSTDLQSAVTRYDYIVNKYGSDAYSDFAHRVGTANFAYKSVRGFSPFETLFGGDEESMSSTVIIIASSVSLLSLTALGVLILKKRKARP
ncbi:MAG: InlB B-repeat-containing protein, partial [Bacilli bacterium]|nr:InlB B-repeat-containing protein [Bacilli bacterium]